ncbi:MAG: PAS domain S-box protein [Gammaproteobacteria bacterium]|nr:PAS domain S-box protein [Gammaproteobacteria bacterium]NNJ50080.1 PAS domain S-box protein [Gammaproteobacteria bacterium]
MNLHIKLFLPVFLLIAAIAATMHYYWLPNYLALEIERQHNNELTFTDLLGTALVPDLLKNDLAEAHATLDRVLENREYWYAIKLYDQDQQVIYPLVDEILPEGVDMGVLEHDITFNGNVIAHFKVWIDFNATNAQRISHITHLEQLLLLTLLGMALVATLLQDKWIRTPLQQLARFASDIARGKYDSRMEYQSRDEVGRLVDAFNSMREQIKQRETDLVESQARNKAVIENAVDGIVSIDARGNVITFNPAAEIIFGYGSDEVTGQNVNMLMPQPYKREHDGYLYNYLETGKKKIIGIGREVEGLRKDGTTFPLELAISEVQLDDRKLFIGIIRDITERKKIEQMKSEFVSTVSHELRTPLTSIRGALSLVLGKGSSELPPKLLRMLETANRNSERLTFLINDILDLEKINGGKLELHLEAVNLAELAKRATEENEGYAHSHQVNLKLSFEADPSTTVRVDEHRLLQVFANLISNAVKYSPQNDTVEIRITRSDDRVHVSVIDHGPGISDEFRTRIFGRFAQADSSDTREKGGTGLGLTITKAIVEQLGGNIGFNSQPGEGSDFYFELSAWDQSVENNQLDESLPKVLICEDDPDVAYVLVNLLEQEGLSGDIAATAKSARELLARNDYRLLLLDLKLPDANGLELVRVLRADEATRKLPIIVVSGRANEGRKEFNGDAVTVADWLQKPIDRDRLSHVLADVMRGDHRPQILHVEDDLDVIQVTQVLFEEEADFDYATTLSEARQKLANESYDLVIIDLSLPDGSGLKLLDQIEQGTPIVLFSGQETDAEINEKVTTTLTKSRTSNEELMQTVRQLLNSNT